MSDAVGSSLSAPGSINDSRTAAHLAIGQRLGSLDLTPLLVYTVTGAPSSVIPFLAWQFDLLNPLWQLIAPGESQTQMVQNAVTLHKVNGTLATLTNALVALGFAQIVIEEGQSTWGGDSYPSDQGWAVFRVLITAAQGTAPVVAASWDVVPDIDSLDNIDTLTEPGNLTGIPISATLEATCLAAINFFKPQRCVLDSLWFVGLPLSETISISASFTALGRDAPLEISEFITGLFGPVSDTFAALPLYNKHYYHCGITYGADEPVIAEGPFTVGGTAVALG